MHILVPCLRLQLENGRLGLKELRVSHWQPLAELGLEGKIKEKNKLEEKKEKIFKN